MTDEYWMRKAIALARRAEAQGEVPVGAVLVNEGKLLSEGFNQPITTSDPCAHAELLAGVEASIREADLGERGTWHRVQLGPFARSAANTLCSQLKSRGQDCLVVRSP